MNVKLKKSRHSLQICMYYEAQSQLQRLQRDYYATAVVWVNIYLNADITLALNHNTSQHNSGWLPLRARLIPLQFHFLFIKVSSRPRDDVSAPPPSFTPPTNSPPFFHFDNVLVFLSRLVLSSEKRKTFMTLV